MQSEKKRSSLDIIANILELAQPGKKKTFLLYRSNLSYNRFNSYLQLLLENHLLEEENIDGEKKLYSTTLKGKEFLSNYRQLSKTLDGRK